MSYNQWREQFIVDFVGAGGSYTNAKKLLRCASTCQRCNEIECSIDVGEKALIAVEHRCAKAIQRASRIAKTEGWSITPQGDPRGFPLTVVTASGFRIGVPGRGLPASAFR